MARSFDGANDNLTAPDNSSPSLDVDTFSVAMWFIKAVQPAATQVMLVAMTAASGIGRGTLRAMIPTTAGFQIAWLSSWSVQVGLWQTGDLALATRYHIAVTYDRASATNDPIIYVNGVAASLTETTAPSVTPNTGGDTVRSGESAVGANDLEGIISHQAAIGGVIFTANEVNRAMWWGRPIGGLHFYQPLVTDKLTNEGTETGATYTASGTTMAAFAVPTVRPGTAMMGMGIGW